MGVGTHILFRKPRRNKWNTFPRNRNTVQVVFMRRGMYVKKDLAENQFFQIQSALNSAVNHTNVHITNRIMGSSSLIIDGSGTSRACFLPPNSHEQETIEKLLKQILRG